LKSITFGIVAFAFGSPFNILSNQKITEITSKKSLELNAPVYTQADIILPHHEIDITYTPEKLNSPPPTLRIARGAIRWAEERGLKSLLIVAAKPHIKRAHRDMQKATLETKKNINIIICEEINKYGEFLWFCSDSNQKRTTSLKEWRKRERILEVLPFFIYKIIAG